PYLAADLLCLRVGPDVDELELLATWRQRSAARLVVLTLGERGALGATADSTEVIHVPARDLGPGPRPAGLGATYFATLAHFVFARGCAPGELGRPTHAGVGRGNGSPVRWGGSRSRDDRAPLAACHTSELIPRHLSIGGVGHLSLKS